MKKELLIQAARDCVIDAEHFSMSYFVANNSDEKNPDYIDEQGHLTCGTTLCLAGRIAYNYNPELLRDKNIDLEYVAYDVLGVELDSDEHTDLEEIFYSVSEITKNNIVRVVEVFCEKGLDGVDEFLRSDENLKLLNSESEQLENSTEVKV